jgi:transcription antitermination factor NusG
MAPVTLRPAVESRPGLPPEPHEVPRWYACYTRARAEKRVERMLLDRDIGAYLPTMALKRAWADRQKVVALPLFPSYVFGRFELRELHRVLTIPGVATVVRLGGRPAPIPDADIENIRRVAAGLTQTNQRPELRPFQKGDRVVVTDGHFRGLVGVVILLRGRTHVLVGLRTIGHGLSVQIDEGLLQAITAADAEPRP